MVEEKNTNNPDSPNFSNQGSDRNRKIAVVFLSVFAIAVIIFGFLNFKNSIGDPWENSNYSSETDSQAQEDCLSGDCRDDEESGDNWFSDWEVEDSSSLDYDESNDLLADQRDLSQGGQIGTTTTTSSVTSTLERETISYDSLSEEEIVTSQDQFEKILAGQADIKTLRQVLLDSGMRKQDLDQISDQVLLETYEEMTSQ